MYTALNEANLAEDHENVHTLKIRLIPETELRLLRILDQLFETHRTTRITRFRANTFESSLSKEESGLRPEMENNQHYSRNHMSYLVKENDFDEAISTRALSDILDFTTANARIGHDIEGDDLSTPDERAYSPIGERPKHGSQIMAMDALWEGNNRERMQITTVRPEYIPSRKIIKSHLQKNFPALSTG